VHEFLYLLPLPSFNMKRVPTAFNFVAQHHHGRVCNNMCLILKRTFMISLLVLLLLFTTPQLPSVSANIFLHHPRGSNNRNRERSDNRQNGNRLFDSQNSGTGGYPWAGDPTHLGEPDPVTYYHGSILRIQWTQQHGCGANEHSDCTVIIQYGCESDMPGLRDGYPMGDIVDSDPNSSDYYKLRQFAGFSGQNAAGTQAIPTDKADSFYAAGQQGGQEFGYHESIEYYRECSRIDRNFGLFTGDSSPSRRDARGTRQNPTGNRRGLECPEERDYYPYWRATPFRDAAILTNKAKYCAYFQSHSHNVVSTSYCDCPPYSACGAANANPVSDKTTCRQLGGQWLQHPPKNNRPPDCRVHSFARENHLGNTNDDSATSQDEPQMAHYDWSIPDDMEGHCIIRIRYNVSSYDFASSHYKDDDRPGIGLNASHNCIGPSRPCSFNGYSLRTRPYVQAFDPNVIPGAIPLSLALNGHQMVRTFQDRSHVFKVTARPAFTASRTIWNLGARGRRGNNVQAYPAVEYDFVPKKLHARDGDFVHIQFWGSDFNAAKSPNNGEGWRYSDRTNIVQTATTGSNFPMVIGANPTGTLFRNATLAYYWALLNQRNCEHFEEGASGEQNSPSNCGKLNGAPARFPIDPLDGLVELRQGTYHYMCTRNNNFSNRAQKGSIIVDAAGSS
jgi:hypothetical protein